MRICCSHCVAHRSLFMVFVSNRPQAGGYSGGYSDLVFVRCCCRNFLRKTKLGQKLATQ
jgi:hypothetical protein